MSKRIRIVTRKLENGELLSTEEDRAQMLSELKDRPVRAFTSFKNVADVLSALGLADFEELKTPHTLVPDRVFKDVLADLKKLKQTMDPHTLNEAERSDLMKGVLRAIIHSFTQHICLKLEFPLEGDLYHGRPDAIERIFNFLSLIIVEAKSLELDPGTCQVLLACHVAQEQDHSNSIYGLVTSFDVWQFWHYVIEGRTLKIKQSDKLVWNSDEKSQKAIVSAVYDITMKQLLHGAEMIFPQLVDILTPPTSKTSSPVLQPADPQSSPAVNGKESKANAASPAQTAAAAAAVVAPAAVAAAVVMESKRANEPQIKPRFGGVPFPVGASLDALRTAITKCEAATNDNDAEIALAGVIACLAEWPSSKAIKLAFDQRDIRRGQREQILPMMNLALAATPLPPAPAAAQV